MMRAACLVFVLALPAYADIPPSDTSGCSGKTENAACEKDDKSAGVCVKSTCGRNDYSNGPPPKRVSYECLMCATAPAAAAPPAEAPKKSSCASVDGEMLIALAALLARRKK